MRVTLSIIGTGFLALGMTALATPGLAQSGAPAGSGEDRSLAAAGVYPGQLAPGAVMPPYHASPPYIGPGGFITLPSETTGFGIHTFGPDGADMSRETPTPSRKSLIDDE
jgi:hypothetical protein